MGFNLRRSTSGSTSGCCLMLTWGAALLRLYPTTDKQPIFLLSPCSLLGSLLLSRWAYTGIRYSIQVPVPVFTVHGTDKR